MSRPACCTNTRTRDWHPLFSVGPQCCYAAPGDDVPRCFPAQKPPSGARHAGCANYDFLDAPLRRAFNESYALAPTQPAVCCRARAASCATGATPACVVATTLAPQHFQNPPRAAEPRVWVVDASWRPPPKEKL